MMARIFGLRSLLVGQIGVVASGFAMLAFAPPANGRMLLIPISGASAARLLPLMLARGALIVARGPTPGSLVVDGARKRLSDTFGWTEVVILAAPPSACGDTVADRAGA